MTLAEHALKTASRLKNTIALIYLDLDDLKKINDTSGHGAGDRALVEIARILRQSFREADILARLGGDEFAVMAMEVTPVSPDILTRRLHDRLAAFNAGPAAEAGFSLSVSAGVSTREPDGPEAVEDLLGRADHQMYERKRAKKAGQAGKAPGPSR